MNLAKMNVDTYFEPINGWKKRLRKNESYKIVRTAYHQLQDPRDKYKSLDGDPVGVWVEFTWIDDEKRDWVCQLKIFSGEFELINE